MYSLVEGFQIDKTIGEVISENEGKFFKELDTISLKMVRNYCYANTYYQRCGSGYCYFCTHHRFCSSRIWRTEGKNRCSLILHKGQDECGCYKCAINNKLHYNLL